jgi:hypothetical protein
MRIDNFISQFFATCTVFVLRFDSLYKKYEGKNYGIENSFIICNICTEVYILLHLHQIA